MQKNKYLFCVLLLFIVQSTFAQTTTPVNHFDKVIVSPHIEVTFIEGNEESVTIEKSEVDKEKINIEVNDNTLRVYLDGAKEITKNEKGSDYGNKRALYHGTMVTATVTYKTLEALSLRGEETHICKSELKGDKFRLTIYGDSHVFLDAVNLGELRTTIYGESLLEIKSGSIASQKYTSYGESTVNSLAITGSTGRITAYGEADFRMNVSDEIRITAFGEARLAYKGNPVVNKGLNIGELHIDRID
jgi:hypothetical protein